MDTLQAPDMTKEWDGNWRLIDWDPFSGISEWWLYHDDGSFTIRKVQHNTHAILQANANERAENAGKRWGDGRKVATIPLTVFNALGLDDAIANKDSGYLKKKLNDADFKNFRTFEGNL